MNRDQCSTKPDPAPLTISRRGFLTGVSAAGVSTVVAAHGLDAIAGEAEATATQAARPVGTVFLDMPYVDMSGNAPPYIPPASYGDPALAAHHDLGGWYV